MTLVITDGEFWWSWRELNPRPKFLHTIFSLNKTYLYIKNQQLGFTKSYGELVGFITLPPCCRHSLLHVPQVPHMLTMMASRSNVEILHY